MTQPISPLQDRRQNALEAFGDTVRQHEIVTAVREAIEVATRVKITDDIQDAYEETWHRPKCTSYDALKAAFGAAGFEVVE